MTRTAAALLLALGCLAGCDKVKPITNETTGPVITVTQSATGSKALSSIAINPDQSGGMTMFNVLANDPGGVMSLDVNWPEFVDACTTVGGATYSGGMDFPWAPLPGEQAVSQAPDSGGLVATELFIPETVGPGPFTCNDFQEQHDVARPYGQTVLMHAHAVNFSGKATDLNFPVVFNQWP